MPWPYPNLCPNPSLTQAPTLTLPHGPTPTLPMAEPQCYPDPIPNPTCFPIQASGNKIADLTGFGEAHEALKELDLSDNSIKSFDDLAPLVALPALKVLKLSGNPVCSLPCYKPRVVAMFAGLKQLDDADVTQEEIAEATEWWAAEEARLAAEAEAAEAAAE